MGGVRPAAPGGAARRVARTRHAKRYNPLQAEPVGLFFGYVGLFTTVALAPLIGGSVGSKRAVGLASRPDMD